MIFYPLFGQIALAFVQQAITVTWDLVFSATSSDLVFSNGDLTVANAVIAVESVRPTTIKTTGKWYGEIHVDVNAPLTSYAVIGAASTTFDTGQKYGTGTYSVGILANSGNLSSNGTDSSYGDAAADSDVYMVAIDVDANKVWFGKNGTWYASGNPAAGTNDCGISLTGTGRVFGATPMNGAVLTGRFKAADFSHIIPTGFSAWES